MMTLSKKHKKINCYHLENDKNSVVIENNRKKKDWIFCRKPPPLMQKCEV